MRSTRIQTIATLALKIETGFGETVILTDPDGYEIDYALIGQDLDGYAVAVRKAAASLVDTSLPVVMRPSEGLLREVKVAAEKIRKSDWYDVTGGGDWREVNRVEVDEDEGMTTVHLNGAYSRTFDSTEEILIGIR